MDRQKNSASHDDQVGHDYQAYKLLLGLWQSENPIKTTKLQMLLAVNALLVSAVSISGGFSRDQWYLYAAGMIFSLTWMFSIGRTSLFQDIWQAKLMELQRKYPADPRFSILDTQRQKKQARPIMRAFGGVPSRWYLLFSPLAFAVAWLAILVLTR